MYIVHAHDYSKDCASIHKYKMYSIQVQDLLKQFCSRFLCQMSDGYVSFIIIIVIFPS